ncbi:tripartite motif-containing protein 16-like [Poecilia latipinna]|uniref:tripartite motif-containing protein 16-like n=1 Tax=Poecilia latipinna TaxID=48699 RepID=UPI00072EC516|nr:PREDICTED: tripartite motif-containing protein 16-like [Poecilia latipinna]
MEQSHLDRETFCCFICMDLLKDPVAIPCGHSYCMKCIKTHWDAEDQKGIHSCPGCRETFTPRPVLKKNIMLAAFVEQLKKIGLKAAAADHCYAGPEDVACDVCSERKLKAIKSCLVCLVSYCKEHLQPHYDSAPFRKHKLVEPARDLQENICSRHGEVMRLFCRTDKMSICAFCLMAEHGRHDTVSAPAERAERQRELEERRGNVHQMIQEKENDVKLLHQEVEAINHSADKTVEESDKVFTQLIHLLQRRSSEVKQQIRFHQKTEVSRVKDLQKKLEQEITELKRKDAELEQLSHTEDHSQFLLNYSSLPALSESTHSSSIKIRPLRHFEDLTAALTEFRDKLQQVESDSWDNVLLMVTQMDVLLSGPEPRSRAGFLNYYCEISLDPNTAYERLELSEGNRKVTLLNKDLPYFRHPGRFTFWSQVLSRESLTGRCYWEVEWSGKVCVAVAYKNISRVGNTDACGFGFNDKSWALYCSNLTFGHNNIWTSVSGPVSSRVGVYLDHTAGLLSFCSVSDSMTLIHRVQTTFTQPLLAGVWVLGKGNSAEFCQPSRYTFLSPIAAPGSLF